MRIRSAFLIAALVAAAAPTFGTGTAARAQSIEPAAAPSFQANIEPNAKPVVAHEVELLAQPSIDAPASLAFGADTHRSGVLDLTPGVEARAVMAVAGQSRGSPDNQLIMSDSSACVERIDGQRFIRASTDKVFSYASFDAGISDDRGGDGGAGAGLLSLPLLMGVALAGERNTKRRDGRDFDYPVKAGVKIWAGSIVALNGAYAAPGATALGRKTVGRAKATADNVAGADGAVTVPVERGVFLFANSAAGDAITLADVGSTAYLVDDQTVAKTDGVGTRSAAGTIRDVDAGGVWVEI